METRRRDRRRAHRAGGTSAAALAGAQVKPDNTKVNKGDRDASAPTADQQKNTRSDVEMTRQIRRALMADKSLSTYAHNIKSSRSRGK
jgi:hyperosmotically inducible protein